MRWRVQLRTIVQVMFGNWTSRLDIGFDLQIVDNIIQLAVYATMHVGLKFRSRL